MPTPPMKRGVEGVCLTREVLCWCRRRLEGLHPAPELPKACFGPRPLLTGRTQAPPRKGPPEPNLEECGGISCKLYKVFPICALDLMFLWQLLTQICHQKPSDFLGDCKGFVFCKVESITNTASCAYYIVLLK